MIRHDGRNKDNETVHSIVSNMEMEKSLKNQQEQLAANIGKIVLEQIKSQIGTLPTQSGKENVENLSEEGLKNIAEAMIKNNGVDGGNIENLGKKHEVKTDNKKIKNTLDILKSLG